MTAQPWPPHSAKPPGARWKTHKTSAAVAGSNCCRPSSWPSSTPSGRLVRMNLATPDQSASVELPTADAPIELVTLSPTGDSAAFVLHNDLWLADFHTLQLRRLTNDGSGTVRNGKADWVYFEEVYNRSWKAFHFSPDGKRIAFQQFNDERVPVFRISDHTTVAQVFEEERYPQAGQANPTVRLGILSVSGDQVQWLITGDYPQDDFLLVNFQWLPDSSGLLWAAQNREQTWLDLLVSPCSGTPLGNCFATRLPHGRIIMVMCDF
ncbi:MAG UNVERIFIED_CONTAM: DPP IV N-terminal domain-containing protein [Planctomycetaceae bacterium]